MSAMCERWIGCVVSVSCVEGVGVFQGRVAAVDCHGQTLTLAAPCCNGIPCKQPQVTLRAADIMDLTIVEAAKDVSRSDNITSATPNQRKRVGRTVSESFVTGKNFYSSTRESPKKAVEDTKTRTVSNSDIMKTPNKKDRMRSKWTEKDEACFSIPVDQIMDEDFDFEKNLALFDKQAVYEEINASQKPDVVRQVDAQRRLLKYRHDENVIESAPAVYRQIVVPESDEKEYVTDSGLVVPSIPEDLRYRLLQAAESYGLNKERQMEIMGHAATEMSLQLLGGGHRLNPRNGHQCPRVVVLCGPHSQGAMGLSCARRLASHGVTTHVYLPHVVGLSQHVATELGLYKMSSQPLATSVKELPTSAVDIIISALEDHELAYQLRSQPWYRFAADWANRSRAPVLALDPPAHGTQLDTKFSLVPLLPLAHGPENGKIYLYNLGVPMRLFTQVGIEYVSPYGPKFVIPLHPSHE